MKKLLTLSALAFIAAAAFALVGVNPGTAVAQENEAAETSTETPAENEQEEEEEQEESRYSYTAQANDSYTKIARKAVQTYGVVNDVELSGAEIVAAETFLTSEAGFPSLDIGQEVQLSEDAVKAAVEKAQGLDDNAEALWEKYVKYVDFNTDNVGEARA